MPSTTSVPQSGTAGPATPMTLRAPGPAPAAAPGKARPRPRSAKVVIAGGFGVGKTTLVGTLSEVPPLTTEADMTTAGMGIDDTSQLHTKTTTTVAMDFGRITIDEQMVLYLFGTPGQSRFGFMWDDLVNGALGAAVLVDLRRIEECFPALDYFEASGIPFVVAVNRFEGSPTPYLPEVREALDLDPLRPLVLCDARSRESVKPVVLTLLELVILQLKQGKRPSARRRDVR
jgi:signal recognition particle receptor subunit beta